MAKFIIPVCLLLLALVHTGYSLKCFACESANKKECGDPFTGEKTMPLNECPSHNANEGAICVKLTTEDSKIRRYCSTYPKGQKACDVLASKNKNIKECLECGEDACNAAGSISTTAYVIFATCIMAVGNVFIRA